MASRTISAATVPRIACRIQPVDPGVADTRAARPAQSSTEQRPEAFNRVDMNFAEAIAVLVAGELTGRMADGAMWVAPFGQSSVDVVLVGVDHRPRGDHLRDQGTDRDLFDVLEHPDHDLAG